MLRRRLEILGLRVWNLTVPRSGFNFDDPDGRAPAFLVQNISGIGNALMATPLLAELRRLYPDARIDFVTTPAAAALLAQDPHATRVIADEYERTRRPVDFLGTVRALREPRYDACFLTIAAIDYVNAVRPVLARIGTRVIHDYGLKSHNRFTDLFNYRVPFDQTRHDVESDLDLLRALTRAEVKPQPLVLRLPDEACAAARDVLNEAGHGEGERAVALCPGSTRRWSQKRWPNEHYLELARRLAANHDGLRIRIFCGPDEASDAAWLRERLDPGTAHIFEGLPLPVYAAALSRCDAVVCGDSLPLHMCAALQVPVVALFGPTDPRRTGPWMCPSKVLVPDCDYIPYHRIPYGPQPGQFPPCMPLLPVDPVEEAVESFLTSRV